MKQQHHYPRHPKRVVEAEKNAAIRVYCKAICHAVKMIGRPARDALKGKNAHYVAAYTGKPITDEGVRDMIHKSTAHVSLSDAVKQEPAKVEQPKSKPAPNKNRRTFTPASESHEVDGYVIRTGY